MKTEARIKSVFGTLVGRELRSLFALKRVKLKNADWLGILLISATVVGLAASFILVLKGMLVNYSRGAFINSPFTAAEQKLMRMTEFLTLCYAMAVIAGIFFGISKINKSLNYDKDMGILLRLPISNGQIFASKLIALYFGQFVFMSGIILPINITFGIIAEQGALFWFTNVAVCVLLPAVSLSLSALFAMPTRLILNALKSRYFIMLALFITFIGLGFYAYARALSLIEGYFISGQIQYVFNEKNSLFIMNIAKYSFPMNFFAKAVFGINAGLNFLYGLLMTAGCFLAVYVFTKLLFRNAILKGAQKKAVYNHKKRGKGRSRFGALMWKEFITVFRTPDYAFSYFATALLLPLMVYCCIGLLSQLLLRMLGMSFNFEIALLVLTMFSVLTNTFCAGNISRDGESFAVSKILPVSYKEIIGAKLVFCSVINVLSVFAACMTLYYTKYINSAEFFIILPIVLLVTTAQIFTATRKDLNKPRFYTAGVEQDGKTASFVITLGLAVSLVLGLSALGLSFWLTGKYSASVARSVVIAVLYGVSTVYAFISALILFKGLGKKMAETIV